MLSGLEIPEIVLLMRRAAPNVSHVRVLLRASVDSQLDLIITAAKSFGAIGVGSDIDPERIKETRENARKAGVTGKIEARYKCVVDMPHRGAVHLYWG